MPILAKRSAPTSVPHSNDLPILPWEVAGPFAPWHPGSPQVLERHPAVSRPLLGFPPPRTAVCRTGSDAWGQCASRSALDRHDHHAHPHLRPWRKQRLPAHLGTVLSIDPAHRRWRLPMIPDRQACSRFLCPNRQRPRPRELRTAQMSPQAGLNPPRSRGEGLSMQTFRLRVPSNPDRIRQVADESIICCGHYWT